MTSEYLDIPIQMQMALGFGYAGYATAFAGLRQEHKARDAVLLSLFFSALALAALQALPEGVGWWRYPAALLAAMLPAALWRGPGRKFWAKAMGKARVHRHMGYPTTEAFLLDLHRPVSQMRIWLKDGTVLISSDLSKYAGDVTEGGFYFGADGSILLHVDEEITPDGSKHERKVDGGDWGTRTVVVRGDEIARYAVWLQK